MCLFHRNTKQVYLSCFSTNMGHIKFVRNKEQICFLSFVEIQKCRWTNTGQICFLECQQASVSSSIDVPFTHTIAMWLSEKKPFLHKIKTLDWRKILLKILSTKMSRVHNHKTEIFYDYGAFARGIFQKFLITLRKHSLRCLFICSDCWNLQCGILTKSTL